MLMISSNPVKLKSNSCNPCYPLAPFHEQHAFRVLTFMRWFPFPEAHRLALAGPESSFVKLPMQPHSTQHALFAPSAADRWATCYGSTALIQHFRGKNFGSTSEFADLGTDAHTLASRTFDYLTQKSEWNLDAAKAYLTACIGAPLPLGNNVDREMVKFVGIYIGAIMEHTGQPANVAWMAYETRVNIESDGEPITSGTADFALITPDWSELQVHDLKYGLGVPVEANNNKQMLLYAAGVYRRIAHMEQAENIRTIRLVIHQPRLHARPEWDCTVDYMHTAVREMAVCVRLGRQLITEPEWIGTYRQRYHLTVTPKGCRWCTAKPFCPKQLEFVADAIEDSDVRDIATLKGDGEKIAAAYAKIDQIKQWCKAVETEALALAQQARLPGYKIVDGRAGDRQWRDEAAVIAFLQARSIPAEQYAPPSLLSPAQADKQLPLSETDWAYLDEKLIFRADAKPAIAPASDARPAKATIHAFDDLSAPPTSGISDLL